MRSVGGAHEGGTFAKLCDEWGTTLIEVMVAATIIVVALVSIAQLFASAIRGDITAREVTYATTLAEQKLEELRSLAWGYDEYGRALSDPRLSVSAGDTLSSNTEGYVDYVDQFGTTLRSSASAPPDAIYVRRWSIQSASDADTLLIQVLVAPAALSAAQATHDARAVRLTTVKARKAR